MNELRGRLDIVGISELAKRGRLAWFGHLERKNENDWMSMCRHMEVDGSRGRGRPVKTWQEVISCDMKKCGMRKEMAQDRVLWRRGILGKPSNPCQHCKMMM